MNCIFTIHNLCVTVTCIRQLRKQSWMWSYGEKIALESYSQTSDNGPSKKRTTSLQRTHSVLRIEITIVVILKQPPRSGRFLIPDSGQDPDSQRHFSIQNCL